MTQDIGVPLYEGFYEIYYNPTPDSMVYPGGIKIYWKAFETDFFSFLESEIPTSVRQSLVTLDLISDGDIAYPKDYVKLSFELRTNATKVLVKSSQWALWENFVSKLNQVDRNAKVENNIWQEQLQEQYCISCLRVLRMLFPKIMDRIMVGFSGDTCEEMINRNNDLPMST